MKECGTRCKNTSESRPPVCKLSLRFEPNHGEYGIVTAKAVIVFNVFPLICAGMKAKIKLGTLRSGQSERVPVWTTSTDELM
jgi:hypothetical protein